MDGFWLISATSASCAAAATAASAEAPDGAWLLKVYGRERRLMALSASCMAICTIAYRRDLWSGSLSRDKQAGENAVRRSAYQEAINLLTRGLELLQLLPDTPERTRQELTLRITLGTPLMATKGWAAPEVERNFIFARELCQQIGKTPQLFPVVHGLLVYHSARGKLHAARELAEQGQYDEGFDTKDLQEAKALLEELSQRISEELNRGVQLNLPFCPLSPGGRELERRGLLYSFSPSPCPSPLKGEGKNQCTAAMLQKCQVMGLAREKVRGEG